MNHSVSLAACIDEWMNTYKAYTVKQSTYDRLLTSVRALEGFSIDIQKYVNQLAASGYGLSPIKKQMRIVTAPLKQAAALHQIPANPAVGIRLPVRSNVRKAERTAEAYSQEEQDALCKDLFTRRRRGYAALCN